MGGTNLYGQSGNSVAPILFGCIDFYSVTSDAFLDLLLPVSLILTVSPLQVADWRNKRGELKKVPAWPDDPMFVQLYIRCAQN